MTHIGEVNEGSDASLLLTFIDPDGAPVTPSSVSYRIDTGNGVPVRALTTVTPSTSTHTLNLTGNDVYVMDATLMQEPHIVTVKWYYGGGKSSTMECRYDVLNLMYV